jgi:RNA polymerase sigma factor (sigma-70 family)
MSADQADSLLQALRGADPHAESGIFGRYFPQLVHLARSRLPRRYAKPRDEDDVVQSALKSFFHRFDKGDFPDLRSDEDLWSVLCRIVMNKLMNTIRHERAQRRSQDRTVTETQSPRADRSAEAALGLDELLSNDDEQMRRHSALLVEYVRRGLELLEDDHQRKIARMLMVEGKSQSQIAKQFGVAPSTISRTVGRIRKLWQRRLEP